MRVLDISPGSNSTRPIHCIAGRTRLIAGLRAVLKKAGIDDDDIRRAGLA
jgi:hypothetical protein